MPELREVFRMVTQKVDQDPGALERQVAKQRRATRNRRVSAFATVAVLVMATVAVFALTRGDTSGQGTTTPANEPSVINPVDPAEEVARSFLDAFGVFDADRAMTYVADDADLAGMEGFPDARSESLSMLTSFLQAFGWNQTITSCEVLEAARATDTVVCAFDWHGLRSDEIDRGPFSDSEFVITVRDSEIVEASWYWNIQTFSGQMWDPFAAWMSKSYPEDVEVMYENGQTDFRLTPESIRLWDRHSREYVKEVLASEGE